MVPLIGALAPAAFTVDPVLSLAQAAGLLLAFVFFTSLVLLGLLMLNRMGSDR